MIVAMLITTAVVVVALITVLIVRDRGRDRSAARPPERGDWDQALSTGVPGHHREQGGPGGQ
ncbi:hypothetical protein MN205_04825 [Kineococcus sp. TRM81007]|uniref:hypothetical protein n=1 Tax=Kineococcus sp. TRM81007 TaxID=2925831 RepID=UPI001F5A0525|nr:hypothetical protein [Kineococcus sp. TRM81007]MCI2237812.1 hypothetical protein [Kineococcus sp. TRM81007]